MKNLFQNDLKQKKKIVGKSLKQHKSLILYILTPFLSSLLCTHYAIYFTQNHFRSSMGSGNCWMRKFLRTFKRSFAYARRWTIINFRNEMNEGDLMNNMGRRVTQLPMLDPLMICFNSTKWWNKNYFVIFSFRMRNIKNTLWNFSKVTFNHFCTIVKLHKNLHMKEIKSKRSKEKKI